MPVIRHFLVTGNANALMLHLRGVKLRKFK